MLQPLISICIPSYNKPQYIVRCLASIQKQDYKNVEVIISDDTPHEDIKHAIAPYVSVLNIHYFHNEPALKSPKNWNAALNKASGEFVLLLHQDDWLERENTLSTMLTTFDEKTDFVFCQNTAIDPEGKKIILQARPNLLTEMKEKPNHLVLAQVIGPPSNTMLRSSIPIRYDEQFIWLVDVDYYARLLKAGYAYKYIPERLVSIGLHEDQTTQFCRDNPDIIFRENLFFAAKLEPEAFNDILIFDYYWRLVRNYGIRTIHDFQRNGVDQSQVIPVLKHMFGFQRKLPYSVLKLGPTSKLLMTVSYISWRQKH